MSDSTSLLLAFGLIGWCLVVLSVAGVCCDDDDDDETPTQVDAGYDTALSENDPNVADEQHSVYGSDTTA